MADQKMILEITEEELEALQANIPVKTDEEMTVFLNKFDKDFVKVSFDKAVKFSLQEMRWKLTPAEETRVHIYQLKNLMDISNKEEYGEFMEIVNAVSFNNIFNTPDGIILKYLEDKRTEMLERRGITEEYFSKCLKEYRGKENKFYKKHFKSKKGKKLSI